MFHLRKSVPEVGKRRNGGSLNSRGLGPVHLHLRRGGINLIVEECH